jgi:hypothetical protein
MTRITTREVIRLLLVAVGILCCAVACVVALSSFGGSHEVSVPGVVKFGTTMYQGVETNYAYVVWRGGTNGGSYAMHPEPRDWSSSLKEGDLVTVLVDPGNPKGARLKSTTMLWQIWRWPISIGCIGIVLAITGMSIVRRALPST